MSTQSKWVWALLGILIIGGALWAFGVPAQYILIGAVLLCCPLMMLFMGGHDMGGDSKKDQTGSAGATRTADDK